MSTPSFASVTQLLEEVRRGKPLASDRLIELVYDELRLLARARLAQVPPNQTLQATALVHEAYLKVMPGIGEDAEGRAHFFGAMGQAMREILIEQARHKGRLKRGGDRRRIAADLDQIEVEHSAEELLEVDRALDALEAVHPDEALLVKLRFFSGLPMNEIAAMLDVPSRTLQRRWTFAQAWLRRQVERQSPA
jgi:RNA polymerase sigma factor (TIGR02999 family)